MEGCWTLLNRRYQVPDVVEDANRFSIQIKSEEVTEVFDRPNERERELVFRLANKRIGFICMNFNKFDLLTSFSVSGKEPKTRRRR